MFGTYKPEDVTILLKDISGLVKPQPTEEREIPKCCPKSMNPHPNI